MHLYIVNVFTKQKVVGAGFKKLSGEVIINKMRSKLEDVIEPAQFAYQPHIGTVDALIKLLDDFTSVLDHPNVKFIQSAAFDFSKASDRLKPALLI